MIRRIAILTLLGTLACASPSAFDVPTDTASVDENYGIVIGRAENWGTSGMVSKGWRSYTGLLLGIASTVHISLDGEKSSYGFTDDGFFILKVPEGEITDLQIVSDYATAKHKSSTTSGNVTITSSTGSSGANFYSFASKEDPLEVQGGQLTIIPVHSFRTVLGIGLELQRIDETGDRNEEILQWFRAEFPELAAAYPAP